jgi:hypothetical protein
MKEIPNEITLDRSWYSRQFEAYLWLREHFGDSYNNPNKKWDVFQAFGYTTITFDNVQDADKFRTWVAAQDLVYVKPELV